MKKLGVNMLKLLVVSGSIFAAVSSQASLIPAGAVDLTGTGLGAVSTILTIHDNDGTQSGEVLWNGTGDVATGDVVGPNVQTKTQSFGDMDIESSSDIRIIFNPAEPGNDSNPVMLNDLVLNIYAPDGTLLFTSGAFDPVLFSDTSLDLGTGNAGFVFKLDAEQAADAAAHVSAENRVGLSAVTSLSEGGNETFFGISGDGDLPCVPTPGFPCDEQEIPEPGTLTLLGIGLIGAGVLSRRRRKF